MTLEVLMKDGHGKDTNRITSMLCKNVNVQWLRLAVVNCQAHALQVWRGVIRGDQG